MVCFDCVRLRNKFFRLIESKEYSWDEDSQRYLLMAMLMTSSDLAASTKQWHVQKRAARLVTDEFIEQGDKERFELKIQPQALMDRERQHELPQLQIRWIADICLPLYQVKGFGNPRKRIVFLFNRNCFCLFTGYGSNESKTKRHERRRNEQHASVEQIGGRKLQKRERGAKITEWIARDAAENREWDTVFFFSSKNFK